MRNIELLSIFDEMSHGKIGYSKKEIMDEFGNLEQEEPLQHGRINKEKIFLVGRNLFFIYPTQRTIKPESRPNLLAVREVLNRA